VTLRGNDVHTPRLSQKKEGRFRPSFYLHPDIADPTRR